MAPKLRLNGHALFVHAAPHRELPDLPLLVDTVSNVSMLPYNWYMSIPEAERPALAESPLQRVTGNQSKFNIEGVARFDICIKDMSYPCLMHVSPDETSGVLGMDFMVQHRVVVDPGEQRLNINGVPMEVLDFSGKRLNSRVTAIKTVHLQPKERYVVPGLIAGWRALEERTVVVEGAHSLILRHGAMAARVVARARNGVVPMEVKNVTDEVQTIHKGTLLGVAFQTLEMKPWVDVNLKGSSTAPDDVTAKPTGTSDKSTDPSVESTDESTEQATVHRINVGPPSDGEVLGDDLPEHVQELYNKHHKLMILDTDASAFAIGGVLSQMQRVSCKDGGTEEVEKVIAYASRTLEGREQHYCTRRRELLAIVAFVKHFRAYLYGRECLIRTDHASLKYIKSLRNPDDQDDYVTQAELDRVYVRHNTATLKDSARRKRAADTAAATTSTATTSAATSESSTTLWVESTDEVEQAPIEQMDANSATLGTDLPDVMAFVEQWQADEMSRAQQADPEIAPLYRAKLADDKRPLEAIVSGWGEATKAYLHDWDRLSINANGLLYRKFESHDGTDDWQQVLLPQTYRLEACRRFHDVSVAAHMGRRKTQMKMQRRFHWHRMAEDIRWWIATCDSCQKRKCPHAWPRAPMQLVLAGEPNERVAMDIVDHLQVSNSGNCCVLSITDHFSKYVKAIPLPNQQAETIADAFVRGWIAVFGAPLMLHTDQGRNFDSAVIAEMCQLLDIYKTRTSAYHPAGNGQTERYNRCVMDMIHAQIRLDPSDWDRALALACLAYNSTPHTSTGFEPNRLMLGRNTYMPADRMMPHNPNVQRKTITEFARELDQSVRRAHQLAREHTFRAATTQKKYYDRTAHLKRYKVGDTVQLKVFRKEKGVGKFADRFEGPYYVLDVLSDVNFRIIRAMEDKPRVVHHDHIIPYLEREPEPACDKAWVFKRSRTYRPPPSDVAAQTDVSAMQEGDGSTAAKLIKLDVAADPTNVDSTSITMHENIGDFDGANIEIISAGARATETRDVSDDVTDVTFARRRP